MKVSLENVCGDYDSYRANRVKSMFNAESGANWKKNIEINLPKEWGLGLVVGPSGSGKTSLGKKFFGSDKIYDPYANWEVNKPIIDCISPFKSFDEVTGALSGVGLGTVPAWLRPFKALSNGEQFRAGLARAICEAPKEIVIDEFTSVVDRQIAKIGALAFGKAWRRNKGKRAVLLSCHYDVIEWLQPDWVFDISTGHLKKKEKLMPGLNSSLKFGRSRELTGKILKNITI